MKKQNTVSQKAYYYAQVFRLLCITIGTVGIWKERICSLLENQYFMFADIEKLLLNPTNL